MESGVLVMATSFDVLYLGVQAIIDPTEGNALAERAASLIGLTFGNRAQPLAEEVQFFAYMGAGIQYENNSDGSDTFSIDGGPNQSFDAAVLYQGTLTYTDGTTATNAFLIVQDTAGRTYLFPSTTQAATQAALEAKPILSLTINSVQQATNDIATDRDPAIFDDGSIIQGSTSADTMGPGYIDSDGDQIDGNNNTISAMQVTPASTVVVVTIIFQAVLATTVFQAARATTCFGVPLEMTYFLAG